MLFVNENIIIMYKIESFKIVKILFSCFMIFYYIHYLDVHCVYIVLLLHLCRHAHC